MALPGNAAQGQCGPTALIVQDLLGGDLLIADVSVRCTTDMRHSLKGLCPCPPVKRFLMSSKPMPLISLFLPVVR
ncbi:YunG family protein [Arthrobacter terrae]|uniref:YunG family protein n=1 Tax=Arthrobacter terrae TaxID=2935737 RepID=UPI00406BB70B